MKNFLIILALNIVLIGNSTPAQRAVADKYSPFVGDFIPVYMTTQMRNPDWMAQTIFYDQFTRIDCLENTIISGYNFFEIALTHEIAHYYKGINSTEEQAEEFSYQLISYVNQIK